MLGRSSNGDAEKIAVPRIPSGLRGFNLYLAFLAQITMVGLIGVLLEVNNRLASVVEPVHPNLRPLLYFGAGIPVTIIFYQFLVRIVKSAERVALRDSADAVQSDAAQEATDTLLLLEHGDDPALRAAVRALREDTQSIAGDFARRFFPERVAWSYRKLIVVLLFPLIISGAYFAKSWLNAVHGLENPDIHTTIGAASYVVVLSILLVVLGLTHVQHRSARFKDWRIPQRSFMRFRQNLAATLGLCSTHVEMLLKTIESWKAKVDAPKFKSRQHLADKWRRNVEETVLFRVAPFDGRLIDLPSSLEGYYDSAVTGLRATVMNLGKSETLAIPRTNNDFNKTVLGQIENDLSNLKYRLDSIQAIMLGYNALVSPYLTD